MSKNQVNISDKARKDLNKVPDYIAQKLDFWASDVEQFGIITVRKIPGYHDEPLKGDRKGQRSIRLNRSYRAIYVVKDGEIQIVEVIEVTKHKY